MSEESSRREGSLGAPTRHPLDWKSPDFYHEDKLNAELERVFDICHGCRRCFSLCNAFPTLFDLVDESETGELDSVPKKAYWDVVDHCYLCDMCFMTKCPYVPPHEWNVDFPHLMLRAKARKFKDRKIGFRDSVLSSTDTVGKLAGIPVVAAAVNAGNRNKSVRGALERTLGVHRDAPVPVYHTKTLLQRTKSRAKPRLHVKPTSGTRGRVALFATCYGNRNEPDLGEDLIAVFEHNGIPVRPVYSACCGMPKLELGDLDAVQRAKGKNVPVLAQLIDEGWDIVAPVPSCVLMFKQELPLMFPDDTAVQKVKGSMFDPFEYLMLRHKAGELRTDFSKGLGKVSYHVACHLRVQNIGLKTRDILTLIPGTSVEAIERCSGHDGTYAVKKEFYDAAAKIARPVVRKIEDADADFFSSDCPMAGHQLENGLESSTVRPTHPLKLLRTAYDI